MKKSGAALARYALEQLGVTHTFGIPGVHNTELYDELNASEQIHPVLVAHEGGGAFMADAVSRMGETIGTMVIVPAAGVTHAASGIGEAGLDGIPMLVISGGIHTQSGHRYQLHDMDQHTLLSPITKATFRIESHAQVIPTIYEAYRIATSQEPGPVFVELPYNIGNFLGEVEGMPAFETKGASPQVDKTLLKQAAQLLSNASKPGIFVGWGAIPAADALIELAEYLGAPVCTTLQGLSAFPGNHPLHTGMGFGDYAVPAAAQAFADCDCLLAIGTRFAEIPTGSYSMPVPEQLIHLDINPEVFSANFPAKIAVPGDSQQSVPLLLEALKATMAPRDHTQLSQLIADAKASYKKEWLDYDSGERVNPGLFFDVLRRQLEDDAILVADDGNHTFLMAELMPVHGPRQFISPSDFNAMGYCIPAVIGAKLAKPDRQVVGVVGDGALKMTGLELSTASQLELGCVVFVFNDGELSQIAQAQEIPYNRKTCTVLKPLNIKALAETTDCRFMDLSNNEDCERVVAAALKAAHEGETVLVDVNIDYSKRTRFTRGVVKSTLKRFETRDKIRVISRALIRKITG
ncbi:thiamine pyrophosphate-binding protein [Aliidiomarina halalkaliphila]|uniref:Thiamine pyrophosphate-binding protein n=1 Tax=Aliidiomarina halalkaliphila TaxID=2593535 RepID=A0A552WZ02_9GAMM|nr:thiamine pyrophosphate-binding protein [Aliidiomarina halalkaliphila]TRW47964.1 thiamine pyrophosphate-binding protein [Aliidiomarina halalkaliphila]